MANPIEISRRQAILGGAGMIGAGVAAGMGLDRALNTGIAKAGGETGAGAGAEALQGLDADLVGDLLALLKERQAIAADKEAFAKLKVPTFKGFPSSVDSSVVDVARADRGFDNTITPARAFLAEPGALLVGPDFGDTSGKNPYTKKGVEPKGWTAMYESKGHINPFNPGNTEVIHTEPPFYQNLPEGGFVLATLGHGTFTFGRGEQKYRIDLPHKVNNTYLVVIRGYYPEASEADGLEQNSDQNDTLAMSNFKPGHAQVHMYMAGRDHNSAFISEEQVKQMLDTAHSGGTNYGAGGSGRTTIVFADANSGAWDEMEQVEGRHQGGNSTVQLLNSNWQK